jgi:NADH:ubiquinone oxidoreductase subunit 6 (subunit J)
MFFVAGLGAVGGAIGVVAARNPFYSVLSLVFHLLSLAALFLLLQAQFVAAAQVIVYAGAVMVLYVFVVAYVGGTAQTISPVAGRGGQLVAGLFAGMLAVELLIALLGSGLHAIKTEGAPLPAGFGQPREIGRLLLTDFLLPFEVASFLLLIGAVGAVLLARRRGGLPEDEQKRLSVYEVLRPASSGTMAEAVGSAFHMPQPPERER